MDRPVDLLTEEQLAAVNGAHLWDCCTVDRIGRHVGRPAGRYYEIPHRLVEQAHEWLNLTGKSVVEFGCLEGAQTVSLCELARTVTAIDARAENLVKTAVRTAIYGHYPAILSVDVEVALPPPADVYFHAGVLYHLKDPVQHLRAIGARCESLLLDTHHAVETRHSYTSLDRTIYRCDERPEQVGEIRAGMRPMSRWITLSTIKGVLGDYFSDVATLSDRMERNGPRCTIIAKGGKRAR